MTAIHIRLRNADIKREQGYDLPPLYMPLLREEGRRAEQAVRPVFSGDEDIVSPFPEFPEEAIS